MKHAATFTPGFFDPNLLPDWVPDNARAYLEHTANGRSIRALAREKSGYASTFSRHIQRLEGQRDDPLVDAALCELETYVAQNPRGASKTPPTQGFKIASDTEVETHARRILRRLCETSAFLIFAQSMEKAAVMRQTSPGKPVRIAVVDNHISQAFALKGWIECYRKSKISYYHITAAGKAELKQALAKVDNKSAPPVGTGEAPDPFQEQHKLWDDNPGPGPSGERPKGLRYNLAESPVTALGRRKGPDGNPFLTSELICAADQLREDFEIAQMGPRVTQNWDRFLTLGRTGGGEPVAGPAQGPAAARERVAVALKALGPGLGDIALRCCCFLEGLEAAEKRMGWSARSGKIVLRIALMRLKNHYDTIS